MEIKSFNTENLTTLINEIHKISHYIDVLKDKREEKLSDRWVNNREFCEMLSIKTRTAQSIRDRNEISYSKIGNRIYYKILDIENYLEKHYKK